MELKIFLFYLTTLTLIKINSASLIPNLIPYNLTSVIGQNDLMLLEFYSSNCPECDELEQILGEIDKVKEDLKNTFGHTFFVGKINSTAYAHLIQRYGIYRYPT